ncbi:MAG: lysine--tRNA ligase [Planctomycetota bacterium]|nr:MAG: lysine--tRNA ligase [Planctomycetota bacterium]
MTRPQTGGGGDERQVRIAKLEQLREDGMLPYPDRYDRTHTLAEALALGESLGIEPGESAPEDSPVLRIAGRVVALRAMGRLSFGHLQDHTGRLQFALNQRVLGKGACKRFLKRVDLADHVGLEGRFLRTRRGEITLNVTGWRMLSKALRPLPAKWHGLHDQETRWRQRYLDLIVNPETRERFRVRGEVVRALRRYLEANDFVEVETPVLAPTASGALARPFVSHHNALDMEVYLRIAPETYLKRLIVGGYDRVFEMARCFRNEGMDPSHLQEFTMLEWYAAYWNYEDNMRFTEALVRHTIEQVCGSLQVQFAGEPVDFGGEWPRRSLRELILEDAGIDIDACPDAESLRAAIAERGIDLERPAEEIARLGRGNLIDRLYKVVSRRKIRGPLFLVGHPADLSPLARRSDDDPGRADRFQLVVCGWEIVNAYSELIDPLEQRRRLEEQAAARAAGDEEAMAAEEDYLVAMEHGMPPVSGFGMGIDRFCALLTGAENLRDVVFFPLMRPLAGPEGRAASAEATRPEPETASS